MTEVRITSRGTEVTIRGGGSKRVTIGRDTVAKINNGRPQTMLRPQSTPVNVVDRPTVVQTGNAMGAQGPRGAPGGSIPEIAFSYGDAPRAVFTADSAGVLVIARMKIDTPFNGALSTIRVGTSGDAESVLAADANTPSQAYEYENTPDIRLAAGDAVILAITPGTGCTQGDGRLFLTFLPD